MGRHIVLLELRYTWESIIIQTSLLAYNKTLPERYNTLRNSSEVSSKEKISAFHH